MYISAEWLEERLEEVYKKDPKYSDKATSLFMLDLGPPEKLPDALRGEKWSFVQLPLSALQEELRLVEQVANNAAYKISSSKTVDHETHRICHQTKCKEGKESLKIK